MDLKPNYYIISVFAFLLSWPLGVWSQAKKDTITVATDSVVERKMKKLPAEQKPVSLKKWVPDSKRSLWMALVLPGGGQIYNKKYWKLPLVYGGFMGCAYALTWNNMMYKDYSKAYMDLMDSDPTTRSYMDFVPLSYRNLSDEEIKSKFQDTFRNRKNYYRKYRDMSLFCFIGVYLLSVVDAYVDAELSNFDISKDLSVQLEPSIIRNDYSFGRQSSYGVQFSINF